MQCLSLYLIYLVYELQCSDIQKDIVITLNRHVLRLYRSLQIETNYVSKIIIHV